MFLRILELIVFILFVWMVISQILIPAIFARPSWPLFRRKKLENKLAEAKEELDQIKLVEAIKKTERESEENWKRIHKQQ